MYKLIVQLRSKLLVMLTHNMALPLLKLIRRPVKFPYSREELAGFEPGTLGKDLVVYLDERKLQLLPYYAKHDIKHILLQYDTNDEGEVCLQCFMLGNGHLSFPVAATVLYGFVTMPEYRKKFMQAYKRGKNSEAIAQWDWFSLLHLPTQQLINKINVNETAAV
jgi:ubiquinone biosynthesis protein Coq4